MRRNKKHKYIHWTLSFLSFLSFLSLMLQLLSTLTSTQTTQNDLLNRVVNQLHDEIEQLQQNSVEQTRSLLQSVTSSLESKMADQERLIGELAEVVESQRQQVAQLQTAIDGTTPPTGYRKGTIQAISPRS